MFLILSTLTAGLSLWCLVWVLSRPAVSKHTDATAETLGLGLRMLWPWISALAPICEPFISWRLRARIQRRVHLAGLGVPWTPGHVIALQALAFIVAAAFMSALFRLSFDLEWALTTLSAAGVAGVIAWWPQRVIVGLGRKRQGDMLQELPFLLDMTTLCVEAGQNLHGALRQAAHYGPEGPMRAELRHALADMRAGTPRLDALAQMATRTGLPAVAQLVAALAQADQVGASLGPLLRSQSDQRRSERFLKAEQLALQAPVKMLFPLVTCIFPCTFLIIGFPIVNTLLASSF